MGKAASFSRYCDLPEPTISMRSGAANLATGRARLQEHQPPRRARTLGPQAAGPDRAEGATPI